MAEDIKKNPNEITDEELSQVAGGKYTEAEWAKMTDIEKRDAKRNSAILVQQNRAAECKYVN